MIPLPSEYTMNPPTKYNWIGNPIYHLYIIGLVTPSQIRFSISFGSLPPIVTTTPTLKKKIFYYFWTTQQLDLKQMTPLAYPLLYVIFIPFEYIYHFSKLETILLFVSSHHFHDNFTIFMITLPFSQFRGYHFSHSHTSCSSPLNSYYT